jgi:hypothetical protein
MKKKTSDTGKMFTDKVQNTIQYKNQKKTNIGLSAALHLRSDSDKVLERTLYWAPPIPAWQPLKKSLNSSLRMACVLEERLYQGLRFEGDLLLLTPQNWQQVLKYGRPDFLLMESIWETTTNHWHMGQCPNAPGREELLKMVSLAKKFSIPTVFWITKGHEYHEHYKDFARNFDFVFCADPKEAEMLQVEGVQAKELLPCVQPAIYNPFRHYDDYYAFNLGMIYDGWADLDRMTDELSILKEVKNYGLDVIESRYQIFRRRMEVLPNFKDCILGCVTMQSRIQALRYAKAYITMDKTLSSMTTQQWMTLEAAASRLPVVHYGALPENDVRLGCVIECPDEMEFLVEFVRFQQDDLYKERLAHLGWRKVFQEHTFAHRMQKICKTIGIDHDWEEYPKASLITPTFRPELLPRCFQTFERQTYPNKELVVVFNGKDVPAYSELGLDRPRNDVKLANVPNEMFAGACLNQGHMLAEGDYFFRVDDDDYYGDNYILDMMLQARSIDAGVFGKSSAPLFFEGEEGVHVRNETLSFLIAPQDIFKTRELWFGGNSISGSTEFLARENYSDTSYGAADTMFLFNLSSRQDLVFAFMDRFNIAAERRQDLSSHTWKYDQGKLKEKCHKLTSLDEITV